MNSLNGKNIIKKYSFLIGFIILGIIISRIDIKNLVEALKQANYFLIITSLLILIPNFLIKSWRWNYLKKIQNIKFKLIDSFLIYIVGFLIGIVTPAKIGELSKILYLKNKNNSLGKSMVSVFLDRFLDIIYFLVFGYFGIIFALKKLTYQINLIYLFLLISVLILFVLVKLDYHKLFLKKIFYLIIPKKYQIELKINFSEFLNDLNLISIKNYIVAFSITVVSWLIYYYQMYLFALSINLNVPFIPLALVVTISTLISLIPISFLGIGTREATLIFLLQTYTKDISNIILFSQLILLLNISAVVIGIFALKLKPIPFKKQ